MCRLQIKSISHHVRQRETPVKNRLVMIYWTRMATTIWPKVGTSALSAAGALVSRGTVCAEHADFLGLQATQPKLRSSSADECVRVCVYYCRTYYKAVRGGGRRRVEDMCYARRRAEACVDESAHHALGPLRNPVLSHRVRLFSLVPLVWESNPIEPKLQGGWCKTQPPGR